MKRLIVTCLWMTGCLMMVAAVSTCRRAPELPDDSIKVRNATTEEWAQFKADLEQVLSRSDLTRHTSLVERDMRCPMRVSVPLAAIQPTSHYLSRIPQILEAKRQLDALGIELIYAPIPPIWVQYPEELSDRVEPTQNGTYPRFDPQIRALIKALRREGVTVVDLAPAFLRARLHGDTLNFEDGHWNDYGARVAVNEVAQELRQREWLGDFRNGDGDVKPILVYGCSHVELRRGFSPMLSRELNVGIDNIAIAGGGATRSMRAVAQQATRDPDLLHGKKAFVWVHFGAALGTVETDPYKTYWKAPLLVPPAMLARNGAPAKPTKVADGHKTIIVEGTVEMNSEARSVEALLPYTSALLYTRFHVDRVVQGDYDQEQLMAVTWGTYDQRRTWMADLKPGDRFRLHLDPLAMHDELHECARDDEAYEDFSLQPYWIRAVYELDGKLPLPLKVQHRPT